MQKRSKIKKVETAKWKKRPGKFAYELVDPITGGLWILAVGRKKTDKELFFELSIHLTVFGGERPKQNEIKILEIFGA